MQTLVAITFDVDIDGTFYGASRYQGHYPDIADAEQAVREDRLSSAADFCDVQTLGQFVTETLPTLSRWEQSYWTDEGYADLGQSGPASTRVERVAAERRAMRAAQDFGIVQETCDDHASPPKKHSADDRWMGIAVFDTEADRDAAIAALREDGYRYLVTYQDTNGPGLTWAHRQGPRVRPSALERLPSVQRARRWSRARDAFQGSLYRNPGYDLIHDPRR